MFINILRHFEQGILLTALLGAVLPFNAQASEVAPNNLDFASMLGSLLLVVIIILAMAWMLRKMRVPHIGGQKDFMVVRQLVLGTKERLIIVQAGEEQFMVGMTASSVQLISKLEQPLEHPVSSMSFSAQLGQLVKSKKEE